MTATRPVRRRLGARERKAAILAAAHTAFAATPYADVAVPDIARAAGGSPAIVFHYFGSKEGLYAAALAESLDDLARRQAEADAALPPNTSARDRVRTWVLAHLDHVASRARATRPSEEPPAAAATRRQAHEADIAFLSGVLQPADAARDRFALIGFLGLLDAAGAVWAQDGCPEDDRHPLVEAALGALEGALGDWRR